MCGREHARVLFPVSGLPSILLVYYHSSGCSLHQYVFKAFILPNLAPLFSVLMMARERIACQCEWLSLNWAAVYTLHKAMAQITLRIENGACERPLRASGTEIKYKPQSFISPLLFSSSSLHPCHISILFNVFFLSILCYILMLWFAKWCLYVFISWRMSFFWPAAKNKGVHQENLTTSEAVVQNGHCPHNSGLKTIGLCVFMSVRRQGQERSFC